MGYISKGDRITLAEQDLIDQIGTLGSPLQVLRVNAAGTGLEYAASGTGTVSNIATGTGLTGGAITTTGTISLDTPLQPMATLTGNALKYLRVNAGETALEYSTVSGSGATTALDNLAAVAINAALVLATSDAFALGSATKMWADLFLASGAVINFNNGNMTITHSAGNLAVAGGTLTVPTSGLIINATTVTSTGTQLNYLASATGTTGTTSTNLVFSTSPVLTTPTIGVATATSINKVTITAPATSSVLTIADGKTFTSSNTITLTATDGSTLAIGTGGTLGTAAYTAASAYAVTALSNLASVAINTTLVSDTDNTDSLGTSAIAWSDLFLGSGAVITFNSAPSTPDITITHSADTLTFAGGTVVLGTATATGGLTGDVTGNVSGSAATVTGAAQTAITSLGTLTALTVDNLVIDLNTISSTSGNINITPVAGSNITLDGTVTIDAGVVAGMTSLTMSGNVIMGTNSITMTGSIAATGARVTKGWFTDVESTNMPTVGGTAILTSLTAPQFTAIELGHATANTLSASGGVLSVEGVAVLTVAGGTLTGSITLGENTGIALDPAGSADGKWSGMTVAGTAGYTQSFGDLVYLDPTDSRWEAADSDVSTAADGDPRGILGMVVSTGTDGTACTILLKGIIRADAKFPALTINGAVYVGETAGAIQVAIPTGADNVIRVVGFAMTADEIYFNPSSDWQITVA